MFLWPPRHCHILLTPCCLSQASEEEGLRKLSSGMTAADAIKRILLAHKDKDYFRWVG